MKAVEVKKNVFTSSPLIKTHSVFSLSSLFLPLSLLWWFHEPCLMRRREERIRAPD